MDDTSPPRTRLIDLFRIFLRLGLTSFGGPSAHMGYFRSEFVQRQQWLSDSSFADLVALCQFLPGPASSQLGMAIGALRHGYSGALVAWTGFTLPSAVALMGCALWMASFSTDIPPSLLIGLKIGAMAIIAQAVWGMSQQLCRGPIQITLMTFSAGINLLVPTVVGQLSTLAVTGLLGMLLLKADHRENQDRFVPQFQAKSAWLWLVLFFGLLILLPILSNVFHFQTLSLISVFYQAGALVFGGGHVVLPLLQTAVVSNGWISLDTFLAGYSITQTVPGPLFTFAAFLGASMPAAPSGWMGGLICLGAIFAPSFLLIFGTLPYWETLRHQVRIRSALMGVNAAVVGILLATLCHPIGTSTIHQSSDFIGVLVAFVALTFLKQSPWLVVITCGVVYGLIGMLK